MNKRQTEILRLLKNNQGYMTFAEIASQMNVSVKTVRNDIAAARELPGICLETKPHSGVRLKMDEEQWNKLFETDGGEDREIMFFILRRLMKNGSLTAQRLSEQYYLGRTQLDKILDRVSAWFCEKRIVFERRRGKGLSIVSGEFNYRIASLNLYREYIPEYAALAQVPSAPFDFMTEREYSAMCAALGGFEPTGAASAIEDTEAEFGLNFSYDSGVSLLFLSAITVLRIRSGNTITMPNVKKCSVDGESAAVIGGYLADRLESEYGLTLPDAERKFIEFAVDASEAERFENEDARRRFEGMNIELCRLTVRSVNLISEVAGVDLRDDRFFVKQMFLQLRATISRIKYGIVRKNQLLPGIKAKYPNMMAVAWFLGNVFEKELGLEINEHEVGFIALHIGGAIERRLSGPSACIVCDYGVGISHILREKISRVMPEIKITSVFSGRDIAAIKKEQCDFVISTIPLDSYRMNIDVVTVGHLLDERDITKIEAEMRKVRAGKSGAARRVSPVTQLFAGDLVFPKYRARSKDELLHMMCSRLAALGYVSDEFEKSVTDREQATPTDIGRGFAVPHGMSDFVNHSVVAFASLQDPIQWSADGAEADLIFLVAFDLDEDEQVRKKIISFYKSIVTFMEDERSCDELRRLSDGDRIIDIFEKW